MYLKKIGFLGICIFLCLGCVQDSETKIKSQDLKNKKIKQVEEKPSYEKYREGLENLRTN